VELSVQLERLVLIKQNQVVQVTGIVHLVTISILHIAMFVVVVETRSLALDRLDELDVRL
jgi:hypothetical protein